MPLPWGVSAVQASSAWLALNAEVVLTILAASVLVREQAGLRDIQDGVAAI